MNIGMAKSKLHIISLAIAMVAMVMSQSCFGQRFFFNQWEGVDNPLPIGWYTFADDKTPVGEASEWFSKGEGWKQVDINGIYSVASYSSTLEGGAVNTWLVTPGIDVPEGGGMLMLSAWCLNDNDKACKMSIRVSTTGGEKDDFPLQAVVNRRIKPNQQPEEIVVPLGDYAGKTINVAVINEGNDAGILCLGDFVGEVYTITLRDSTPIMVRPGGEADVRYLMDVRAMCDGLEVELTTSDGQTHTLSTGASLRQGLHDVAVRFPPMILTGDGLDYTLTVRPNITGAEPTVASGRIIAGEGFESVCLMEEATGEKCGYCPAGVAVAQRLTELWPGRVLPVAVHAFEDFSTGVMENPEYSTPFVSMPGLQIYSLPTAVLNRVSTADPVSFKSTEDAVQSLLDAPAPVKVEINRVDCDFESGHTTVHFEAMSCIDMMEQPVNAAVILTADGLTGSGPNWFQSNYFSGVSESKFVADYEDGDQWWKYMKFWCEYPSKKVSPTDYQFDHIGLGVYPDFRGLDCPVAAIWTIGESYNKRIEFDMPLQQEPNGFGVQDTHHTAVTVVLLRQSDGAVLNAARVEAANYNKQLSTVYDVMGDQCVNLSYEDGLLRIECDAEEIVEVCSITGTLLERWTVGKGISVHNLTQRGILLVRCAGRNLKIVN